MTTRTRNLGPKSLALLTELGIGPEELKEIGAVEAYLKVKVIWPQASLNLLWALEGAICDEAWQDVARNKRLSLLMALEEAQKR